MHREHYAPPRRRTPVRMLIEWLILSALVSSIGVIIGLGV